jgi:amidase
VFPLSDTLDHVGPMARSVLDAAMMFAAIAGEDPLDPTTRDEPPDDYVGAARAGTLEGVRVGVDPDYALGGGNDAATAAAMNGVIAALKACGAELVDVRVTGIDAIMERAVASALVEAAVAHAPTYPLRKSTYSEMFRELLDLGHATTATDYAEVAIWRREFRGRLVRTFRSVDMLLAPVAMFAPMPVAAIAAMAGGPPLAAAPFMRFTLPFNLAGVPCLTMPMGRTEQGAPLGFQLIGPELAEAKLLSAGAAFERQTGFSARNPDVFD